MNNLKDIMECPLYKPEKILPFTFNTENNLYFPEHIEEEGLDNLIKIKVPVINLVDFIEYNIPNFKEYLEKKFNHNKYAVCIDSAITLLEKQAQRFSEKKSNNDFFFPYNVEDAYNLNLHHEYYLEIFHEIISLFDNNPTIKFIIK